MRLLIVFLLIVFPLSSVAQENSPDFLDQLIKRVAAPHSLEWIEVKAQAMAESRLKVNAISRQGARGLMQIMPATFKYINKKRKIGLVSIDSPEDNLKAGIIYMEYLSEKWKRLGITGYAERRLLSLASYNAGFVRVKRIWRKNPDWQVVYRNLPKETRVYISRIAKFESRLRREHQANHMGLNLCVTLKTI